jgi:hypothetical protein
MADVPVNEKLFAMVVTQAKAKYRIYPSPGASHWVHRRYLELGGKFIDSTELSERKKAIQKFQERRHELLSKKQHGKDKDKDNKKSEDKK